MQYNKKGYSCPNLAKNSKRKMTQPTNLPLAIEKDVIILVLPQIPPSRQRSTLPLMVEKTQTPNLNLYSIALL